MEPRLRRAIIKFDSPYLLLLSSLRWCIKGIQFYLILYATSKCSKFHEEILQYQASSRWSYS
ncbi:hypothetical protein Cantr_07532 [Candida viswanathii]|uniref:Uncharacterized protein n=1 Tax=Candida viswanathii TaxID=5486 RepID=A0A367Y128_9ASCO|nr:hypothetical protein Cantr_07532 [Candida viswanathii]